MPKTLSEAENPPPVKDFRNSARSVFFRFSFFYGYTAGGPFGYEGIFHDSGHGMAILFLRLRSLFLEHSYFVRIR